jgi:DNA-directed RNA polymerase subunit RPC12/RpoP
MAQISSTPQHCPGFDDLKDLKSFVCKCNHCGQTLEIFSDEFDRPHKCRNCGRQIEFSACEIEGEGKSTAPE